MVLRYPTSSTNICPAPHNGDAGVLLFEMIAGHVPFYKEDPFETYQMILKLEYEFPSFLWMAVSAKDLISLFLVLNPHDRIDDFLAIKVSNTVLIFT